MTDTQLDALDKLIAAVEAGAFLRHEDGKPKRYMEFADSFRAITGGQHVLEACVELMKGDLACSAYLRAYRAQVAG